MLLFTHEQVIHIFGTIACIVYVVDRVRIAYPEAVMRRAPWVNRLFVRAEEQVRESAMIPYAIAVLLTILTVPKPAALVAIYTLAVADPLAAVVGIRHGRRRIAHNRSLEGSLAFFGATVVIAALVLGLGADASPLAIAGASGTIAPRNEQAAGHAADGWARTTGRVGIAMVTAGPGVTDVVTAVANAYLDCIPTLFIAGAAPLRDAETLPLQGGFDQVALLRPITKWAHRITQTARIPDLVTQALRVATTRRPGPVFLEIP